WRVLAPERARRVYDDVVSSASQSAFSFKSGIKAMATPRFSASTVSAAAARAAGKRPPEKSTPPRRESRLADATGAAPFFGNAILGLAFFNGRSEVITRQARSGARGGRNNARSLE
nr:hypothetical protein [Verrucomicrobiota bacterium]